MGSVFEYQVAGDAQIGALRYHLGMSVAAAGEFVIEPVSGERELARAPRAEPMEAPKFLDEDSLKNPTTRTPVCLCLDVSRSMKLQIEALNKGIQLRRRRSCR
jgi:hypothetical protein